MKKQSAFTMPELIAVVVIVALLVALILSSISWGQRKALSLACQNNLRHLGAAFSMYLNENADCFPAPGSNRYGPKTEDWLHWQNGRTPAQSSIAKYLGGFQESLFVCPVEKPSDRIKQTRQTVGGRYIYSYSFTSHDLVNDKNPGLSTLITGAGRVYYYKQSDVRNPSQKIMLVDEDRATLDDSRWVPVSNQYFDNMIADRHNSKGVVAFADAHVELIEPRKGLNPEHSLPNH